MIPVEIKKLHICAKLPVYATAFSTCADVHALVKPDADDPLGQGITIPAGEARMVRTGLSVRPAPGYATKLHPRSGLALKHGITLLNCTGIIDHDYSDELCVLLLNTGSKDFLITPGMRIAQLEVHPLVQAQFVEVAELTPPATVDGMAERVGGFGSTGLASIDHAPVHAVLDDEAAAATAKSDHSKNIGQAMAMFGEFLLECSIVSATGVSHFASEEVGNVMRMLGQNIVQGHAVCTTHDREMAHHAAQQACEALQKV